MFNSHIIQPQAGIDEANRQQQIEGAKESIAEHAHAIRIAEAELETMRRGLSAEDFEASEKRILLENDIEISRVAANADSAILQQLVNQ